MDLIQGGRPSPVLVKSLSFESIKWFLGNFERLPEQLDLDKIVKVVKDNCYAGKIGIVKEDYIDKDDCSGTYGKRMWTVLINDGLYKISPSSCEFVD